MRSTGSGLAEGLGVEDHALGERIGENRIKVYSGCLPFGLT
jgi:hypothetical protein